MFIKEKFSSKKDLFLEILRFCIVGGICSLVTFGTQTLTLNVFFGGSQDYLPNTITSGIGFGIGIIVNYILSIFFVFNKKHQKDNGKNVLGSFKFLFYALIGLVIYSLIFSFFYSTLDIGRTYSWVLATGINLIYNYTSRKFLIFK